MGQIYEPSFAEPFASGPVQVLLRPANRDRDEFRAAGFPSTSKSSVYWDPLQTLGAQGEQSESFYTTVLTVSRLCTPQSVRTHSQIDPKESREALEAKRLDSDNALNVEKREKETLCFGVLVFTVRLIPHYNA